MIHFSRSALELAFRRHRQCGGPNSEHRDDSCLLLRVYAAECGLKAVLLQRRGLYHTSRLSEDDLTHELDVLLRLVGARQWIGNSEVEDPKGLQASSGDLHEIFRYGGRLTISARERLRERIDQVLRWIEENL